MMPDNCQDLFNHVFRSIGSIDQRLLGLENKCSQEDLDCFLKDWDIEKSPIQSVIFLAQVMKSHPDLSFNASLTPRLNGVLSYCRFKNLHIETILNEVVNALNNNNIGYELIGDWAMKRLRPGFPRWINDIKILVGADDYNKAISIVSSIKSDTRIILHQSLDGGLSLEKLLFFSLLNIYDILVSGQPLEACVTTLSDIRYISSLKEVLDTEIIWKEATFHGLEVEISIASNVVSSTVSGLFPDKWPDYSLSSRIVKKRLIDFLFRRDVPNIIKKGTRIIPIPSFIKYLTWLLVSKLGL